MAPSTAAPRAAYDRETAYAPTLANPPFMMLEHVNINVGSIQIAKTFYIDTLLAGEDTRTTEILNRGIIPGATGLLWANLGLQQFHLPEEASCAPQMLRGEIHIDYPGKESLMSLQARLQAAEAELAGTQFSWSWIDSEQVRVRCPWGNLFVLSAQDIPGVQPGYYGPEGMLPAEGTKGHPCLNTPVGLGIRAVHFSVPRDTAEGIGRFYRHYFNTKAVVSSTAEGLQACDIKMGAHQALRFVERDGDLPNYDGHHICIYIASFDECYLKFSEEGRVYENPRFPMLTYETLQRARELNEFRIIDIVDPACPEKVLYSLEHEIRHPLHPGFPLKEHLVPVAAAP